MSFSSSFPSRAPRSAAVSWYGGQFSCASCSVRRSARSFSGWVTVVSFGSFAVASRFRAFACGHWAFPFVAVRSGVGGWLVSVPCSVPRRCFPVRARRVRVVRRAATVALALFLRFVGSFSSVGFSGSRRLGGVAASALCLAAAGVSSSASVFVGCASGADALARGCFPGASVFSVSSGCWGSGRAAFARRSAAVVSAVGAGGLWVSFPSGSCPSGLLPSSSWPRGVGGSGSWGSLALAVGSGLSCLVFASSVPSDWGFRSLGGGWWVLRGFHPPTQLSLL